MWQNLCTVQYTSQSSHCLLHNSRDKHYRTLHLAHLVNYMHLSDMLHSAQGEQKLSAQRQSRLSPPTFFQQTHQARWKKRLNKSFHITKHKTHKGWFCPLEFASKSRIYHWWFGLSIYWNSHMDEYFPFFSSSYNCILPLKFSKYLPPSFKIQKLVTKKEKKVIKYPRFRALKYIWIVFHQFSY